MAIKIQQSIRTLCLKVKAEGYATSDKAPDAPWVGSGLKQCN
jgi:hypothetical protein